MMLAWLSASEMIASCSPSTVSNRPPFASQHEEYRMVSSVPRKRRQRRLELLVHGLRAADEAHRGHAITETVDGAVRGLADRRMAGESQVVVSAQVDDVRVVGADLPGLRAGDHAFGLEQALLAQFVELRIESLVEGVVHASPGKGGIGRNYTGPRHDKCARKRSRRGQRGWGYPPAHRSLVMVHAPVQVAHAGGRGRGRRQGACQRPAGETGACSRQSATRYRSPARDSSSSARS